MKRTGLKTKTHNYLLRSRHGSRLVQVMALASAGRVRWDGANWTQRTSDDRWIGNCGWSVEQLLQRRLLKTVKVYGGAFATTEVHPTADGSACLAAVLEALAEAIDPDCDIEQARELQMGSIVAQVERDGLRSLV